MRTASLPGQVGRDREGLPTAVRVDSLAPCSRITRRVSSSTSKDIEASGDAERAGGVTDHDVGDLLDVAGTGQLGRHLLQPGQPVGQLLGGAARGALRVVQRAAVQACAVCAASAATNDRLVVVEQPRSVEAEPQGAHHPVGDDQRHRAHRDGARLEADRARGRARRARAATPARPACRRRMAQAAGSWASRARRADARLSSVAVSDRARRRPGARPVLRHDAGCHRRRRAPRPPRRPRPRRRRAAVVAPARAAVTDCSRAARSETRCAVDDDAQLVEQPVLERLRCDGGLTGDRLGAAARRATRRTTGGTAGAEAASRASAAGPPGRRRRPRPGRRGTRWPASAASADSSRVSSGPLLAARGRGQRLALDRLHGPRRNG